MKLKPIVAGMLLGLAGAPVMAAVVTTTTTTATQTQLDTMKATKIENILNKNQGGNGLSAADTQNWFNNVTVSGLINVDAITSNRTPLANNMYVGDSANEISLTDANLFVDTVVNNWTKVHLNAAHHNYGADSLVLRDASLSNDFGFDEAYVTIADFSQSPFYARLGKQFTTFGDYDVFAVVPSLTQLLTESNQNAAVVGFADASTFNADLFAFRGINKAGDNRKRVQNYGANIGYGDLDVTGYKLNIGYLSSMADVSYLASNVGSTFEKRIPAWTANAGVKSGPFDASLKYVTAGRRFDSSELAYDGKGAKPWAAGVDAGYSFCTMAHASRIGLSYQQSHEAVNVGTRGLPEKQYEAGYKVQVSPNTNLGFSVVHYRDYDTNHGGTDKANTTGVVRLGVNIV
jgi:hypothetical protein